MAIIYRSAMNQFQDFAHQIKFTPKDIKQHYDIKPELFERIKNCESDSLQVTDEEKQIVQDIIQHMSSLYRVPVTDGLKSKLDELRQEYDAKQVSKMIGKDLTFVGRVLRGQCKTTTFEECKRIHKLYHDYKCGLIKGYKKNPVRRRTLKAMKEDDYQKALRECRKYLKVLQVGKTYRIYEYMKDSKLNPYILIFEGTITEEYSNYYLGEHKGRTVTFLKNLLYLPKYRVEEIVNEVPQLS